MSLLLAVVTVAIAVNHYSDLQTLRTIFIQVGNDLQGLLLCLRQIAAQERQPRQACLRFHQLRRRAQQLKGCAGGLKLYGCFGHVTGFFAGKSQVELAHSQASLVPKGFQLCQAEL
jgi:hypothetical protein